MAWYPELNEKGVSIHPCLPPDYGRNATSRAMLPQPCLLAVMELASDKRGCYEREWRHFILSLVRFNQDPKADQYVVMYWK